MIRSKNKFKSLTICLLFISLIGKSQNQPATAQPGETWEIKWNRSDDFNGTEVNRSKWNPNVSNVGVWSWDNNNVKVSNGTAKITVTQDNHTRTFWDGCNQKQVANFPLYYKSGILKSFGTGNYGYYEAKIKGASLFPGVCPAFWLYSSIDRSQSNPGDVQYSEIDIIEMQQGDTNHGFGNDPKGMEHNLHTIVVEPNGTPKWHRPKAYPEENLNLYNAPFDPRDGFHTYGCEVNKDEIIWYVDGIEVGRKENLYWHRQMNVTFSMGMRRQFTEFKCNQFYPNAAATTKNGFPTTMEIDYVRVWEKKNDNTSNTVGFENTGFETGNLTPWENIGQPAAIVSNNTNSGNRAVYINGNSSIQQIVTVKPNTTYTYSAYAKVKTSGQNIFLGVADYGSDPVSASYTSTSYTKKSVTFTTGSNNTTAKLWFWNGNIDHQAYGDDFELTEQNNNTNKVTGISIPVNSATLTNNESISIGYTVLPQEASNKSVTWTSNNTNIASVNAQGRITAVSTGQVIITVKTVDGNFSKTINIYVTNETINTGAPFNSVINLKSTNGKYITTNTKSSNSLQATSTNNDSKEQYRVIDAGDGYIALLSLANNKYVTVSNTANSDLRAGSKGIFNRQKFSWIDTGDQKVSLKAKINNQHIGTNSNSNVLQANFSSTNVNTGYLWATVTSASKNFSSKTEIDEQQELVQIYPNPATDFINISLKNYDGSELSILIYDNKGTIVKNLKFMGEQINLDVSELNGLHMIKLVSESINHVQKLIIN